ncbi:Phospholipid ABC transporter permease protein MlaE [hydrothermal vent metagenome]|uniref:Phospholipid ABC transporter permease protein MlaE n=1 Tax=hydrothermal vent metagenome TaxID=652676 RepID=A0A3B1BQQ1_9ZZZZ
MIAIPGVEYLGARIIEISSMVGKSTLFTWQVMKWMFRPPFRVRAVFEQMQEIGYNSIPVVAITALSTGSVLALQSYIGFKRFGAESMVGTVVALSMTRELGPVLTGLMVAGRAGSAMAAELGTMKVTEQIDALYTLSANPVKYLIVPRFIAATLMLPILVVVADSVGILGGAAIGIGVLDANPVVYMKKSFDFIKLADIYSGLFKSFVFGMIIAIVCCYQGFYTEGGAEGVGKATTRSVVISCILILVIDYVLTSVLFQ